MKPLYAGIDLHSNNNFLGILNERDERIYKQKLPNSLEHVLESLAPFQSQIQGIVVESTFNWYWLVDGLMNAGYRVHLANPAGIEQYKGLKYSDDQRESFWLAHLLRLGLLAEGYIYPKEERPIRDLLRKRSYLVRQHTSNLLSFQNVYARNTGRPFKTKDLKTLKVDELSAWEMDQNILLALQSNLMMMKQAKMQIKLIEKTVVTQIRLRPEYKKLQSINGIGMIIALTIMLETGHIGRFRQVNNYASYCRLVPGKRISNGKKKGKGNTKNGNKYLCWAYIEAANFAIRFNDLAKRFHMRKTSKSNGNIATKALAHKLARASYFIIRDKVDFDEKKLFMS